MRTACEAHVMGRARQARPSQRLSRKRLFGSIPPELRREYRTDRDCVSPRKAVHLSLRCGRLFIYVMRNRIGRLRALRRRLTILDLDHDKTRRTERPPVILPAQCRTQTGMFGSVEIMDLTSDGCRIFAKALPMRVDQRVVLKPKNFQALAGLVRWIEHDFAGIQFESPLYAPVVEHLQRQFGPSI